MTLSTDHSVTAPPTSIARASARPWRDHKKPLWVLGLIIPVLPFLGWGLVTVTGQSIFWFTPPVVVFVVIPIIDLFAGLDPDNPPDEVIESLEEDRYYRWVIFLFLPLQYASLIGGAYLLGGGDAVGATPVTVWDKLGLAFGLGTVAGIAINTAHELGHKKEHHERWLARVALAQTFYGHFYIEHNRGHHVRVATPDDPASSRLGETVWEFFPRTVIGSFKSAWRLEKKRFGRRDQSPWTLRNDVLNAWAMSAVLFTGLVLAFGIGILPYLIVQAVVGIWFLESVNYLEHYGMKRAILPNGRVERVNPSHSWNSNNIGTNVLLYHLQRHSDHHANPTRRYQSLRDFPESPVLPTGYAGMIVLTWVPAIWRRVMDPRVLAHYDGDVTRANLQPRKREALLARHGRGGGEVA
ncbi:alkane 1-monooxygenase [Knoellia sinensis KCTC 19936]|uniref:Alkane 1-monooxygenase n=1 Tax=Knoellia sinensis KCTC 19936 TaxID=1385520 RepID=A0A0A0JAP9_9MICO|nr:alkane 1-monooxygenase [Knoellia sinensis]KGN34223.1 alkane 1-monooxygenase [Knoellia sinensis KCTC 19936]